ncbi:flavodoxin family protein [Cumulibacter manganitolerans]|uniref:flavodoxin family protein n=1 Tax=Cumulibacter manganitolerans TaxID=1884992 RepID=UPI001296385B|nr:flavodoxin family protein [Cumulibacter manganitolerans]
MRALIIVESMWGDTRAVGDAIAQGLSPSIETEVVDVAAAPALLADEVRLLLVGGPTHAFGMTRARTRASAAQQGADAGHAAAIGIRDWLGDAGAPARPTLAAAFDTRIRKPHLPGSAARAAERRLRRLGYDIASPATSFYVTDSAGPLADGELERASAWGTHLALAARNRLQHPTSGHR